MIALVSDKYFDKKSKKLLKVKDYFIIDTDAENTADISSSGYNHVIPVAALLPGNRLVKAMKARKEKEKGKKDSGEISERKVREMLENYLEDKEFLGALLAITKVFLYEQPGVSLDKNIFVVIPRQTYKYLGKHILKIYKKLFEETGLDFIISEEDIIDDRDILEIKFKRKQMKEIAERISKLEKKYKLR